MTHHRLRTLARSTLRTTAIAAGFVCGTVSIALAEPREWDIEEYDRCIQREANLVLCCLESGGEWTYEQGCVAPAAEEAELLPTPTWTKQPLPPNLGPSLPINPGQPPLIAG